MLIYRLIMYFVNTYIGPRYIMENEAPLVDIDEGNHGGVADAWIRDQIIGRNLANREALFRINLWNMVDRVDQGLCRTNNSVEGWHSIWNIHLKGKF
ncbi:unnamed protein product [Meloidogyne enterolobii]|uniref:Uncharacterized protein n=1 Tax=Meloidogyne enterolobii TaxID=390850 RepID=A0ACB1ARS1_MELEN